MKRLTFEYRSQWRRFGSLASLIDGLENDQGEDPEKNAGYHNESAPIKPLE
jgi:hypothetical protein